MFEDCLTILDCSANLRKPPKMKAPVISSWSFWLNGNFSFVINYDEPFWEAALFSPTSDISISTRGWGVQRTAVLVHLFGKCQQFKQQVEQIMLWMRFTLIAFLSLRLKYRFSAVHPRLIVEAAFWHPATISFCRIRSSERVQKLFRRPRWYKLSFLFILLFNDDLIYAFLLRWAKAVNNLKHSFM